MTTCGHPVTWPVVVLGVGIGLCASVVLLAIFGAFDRRPRP